MSDAIQGERRGQLTSSISSHPVALFLIHVYVGVLVKKGWYMPWPVWLSLLECRPVHWNVGGLISGQGTCLGCGFHPWLGCVWEAPD